MAYAKRMEDKMKEREKNFSLGNPNTVRLAEYNALYDPNMRHFFENRKVQRLLYESGQIDKHGRVIDAAKSKPKLKILEREFIEAEKIEERRQKEEAEMRVRIIYLIATNYFSTYFNISNTININSFSNPYSIEYRGSVSMSWSVPGRRRF